MLPFSYVEMPYIIPTKANCIHNMKSIDPDLSLPFSFYFFDYFSQQKRPST